MSTCVSLAQMVDLALGTPEVGAVNFNVLHTLLHAMLSRLDLRGVQAEISKEGSSLLTRNKSDASATDSSGIGTDTEDSPKLKDGVIPQTQSVYHVLEKKVGKLEEQMEKLNALPSNNELFERTKPVGDGERPRPVADMWQSVQLKNRVDANEEGIGKLMSLVEDLMAEMAKIKEDSEKMRKDVDNYNIPGLRTDVDDLRKQLSELDIQSLRDFMDQLKKQMDEIDIQSLRDFMDHLEKQMGELTNKMNDMTDMDELRKRLKQLEDLTNELNDRLSQYPSVDSFTNFVTWTALEEALKGIRSELEPKERIVIEMQTQTSRPPSGKKPSRPPSATSHTPSVPSRPHSASSRTSMSGPSHELAAMLEKLGELNIRHDKLEVRVENLEEEMPNKADKSALSGLSAGPTDIPEDLLAQLQDLQNQLKSLSKAREKWDELAELDQKLSMLPDLSGLEATLEGLSDGQQDLQRMLEALRAEYEATMASLEDKLQSLEELALGANVLDDPEPPKPPSPEPPRKESPKDFHLPPIAGAIPADKLTPKMAEMENALSRKESEMRSMQQKMKWLMQDSNKQLNELKDRLKHLEKELQALAARKTSAKKVSSGSSMDSGGLSRLQQVVLQLQAELDKLSSTTERIVDDNNNKTKQIESLTSTAEKLDRVKADKDYVQSEVDVKADKRLVEGKVNRSLFDQTTDELNNMIKDLLDKLTGHEDEWKQALGLMNEDIDGKLDRLEFGPIRDELERRLKALARQLRELSFGQENGEDDAAGLRKQLLQRFHCISCDRPVEIMPQGAEVAVLKDERPIPSIPAPGALPATRSSRPYTTFELEQIRQHARRHGTAKSYREQSNSMRNAANYKRALIEQQLARFHIKKEMLLEIVAGTESDGLAVAFKQKHNLKFLNQPGVEVVDLYATSRACGGSHTTTHPHRRFTRVTQYNNLFREEEGAAPPPACKSAPPGSHSQPAKEELDIQGADGHIYKGRLEARLPTTLQQSGPANLVSGPKQGGNSPKMTRKVVYPPAAGAPRPPATAPPAQSAPIVPRPTSARQPLSNGVQPARPQSATGQNKGTPMEVPTADTLPDPPPPSSPAAAEATDS